MAMEPDGPKRARKRNYLVQENGDYNSLSMGEDLDPWTAWAYKPRTISLLLIGACFLM